jgi:5-methylcytosine-specific restriction endonuclease McrA
MARNRNSDVNGKPFAQTTIRNVWQKGRIIPGYDQAQWRHDICGQSIKFSDYGNTDSKYGWEVDHIKPVAKGGTDNLENLQPLQWDDNRKKSDTYPWYCS